MKDDSTRKMHRDIKANKQKLYVLESELFELQQKTKHNKDTRNRMKRLTEVITTKRYAAEKVNTLIQKELEDKKKYVDLPE
tara:strand:- start:202 stop:444 length:243 start_codon:yes stop_codon:yes gene_type:complete